MLGSNIVQVSNVRLDRWTNCWTSRIFCFTFQKIIKLSVTFLAVSDMIPSGIMIGITLYKSLYFVTEKCDGSGLMQTMYSNTGIKEYHLIGTNVPEMSRNIKRCVRWPVKIDYIIYSAQKGHNGPQRNICQSRDKSGNYFERQRRDVLLLQFQKKIETEQA